jgi:capsule polysaccharide export protein KpsE/RkpR
VAEKVIKKFKLDKAYKVERHDDVLAAFADRLHVVIDRKSGVISIGVDDAHPRQAAIIANDMVDQLIDVTHTLALSEASQRRIFFETQLEKARATLTDAMAQFAAQQTRSGIVNLEEQGKMTYIGIARVQAEVATKEIQLGVLRTTATEEYHAVVQLKQELAGLRATLARLEAVNNPDEAGLGKLSSGALEYTKRFRDVKYREAVVEILSKLYETSRLDEARDAPAVQVLDEALPPEAWSSPKRRLSVIVATLVGGFVAVLLAFVAEGFARARENEETAGKLKQIRASLFGPLFRRGKRPG